MARNRSKELTTRNFSILNMRDAYEESFETLIKAMTNQNPNIDADAFDLGLRKLISSFGNSGSMYPNEMFASLASEAPAPAIYSSSGDILSLAYASYLQGDRKQAFDLVESAFEETDFDTLIDAIQVNNKNCPIGVMSDDSSDDDTSNDKPSTTDNNEDEEDNEGEVVSLDDDDDDQSDGLENDKPTDNEVALVKSKLLDSLNDIRANDESKDNKPKDTDESKAESKDTKKSNEAKKPMNVKDDKSSDTTNEIKAAHIRAAANKLSLDGLKNSRANAKNLLSLAKAS